jgi:hypothetical protein
VPGPIPAAVGPGTEYCDSAGYASTYRRWRRSRCTTRAVAVLTICCSLAACGDSPRSNGVAARPNGVPASSWAVTTPTTRRSPGASRATEDTGHLPVAEGSRAKKTALRHTLEKFYECLSRSGVTVPSPRPSSGTIPNIGIMRTSPRFKTAWAKCRRSIDLGTAYFYRPSAGEREGGRGP